MKRPCPRFHAAFLLVYLLFVNQILANALQVPPDNSIGISVNKSSVCVGEAIIIFLADSETGVEYQLKANDINSGIPISGTGSQISFTLTPTATATYSITATNTSTSETSDLTETTTVTVNPGPNLNLSVYASATQICKGESVLISVDDTEADYNYLLNNGPDDFFPAIAGNGGTIEFPQELPQSNTTYQIFVGGGLCQDQIKLNNTAGINVAPAPKTDLMVYADKDQICMGESVTITIENSEAGIDYQIFDGSSYVANPLTGTGSNLNFTLSPSSSKLYVVRAFGINCLNYFNLDQEVFVTVNGSLALDLLLSATPSEICEGETTVISIENSESDVQYQLKDASGAIGSPINGNGNQISFPELSLTSTTNFWVDVMKLTCASVYEITNQIEVRVNPKPEESISYSVNPSTICEGEIIVITIDNSKNGIRYNLIGNIDGNLGGIDGNGTDISIYIEPSQSQTLSIQAQSLGCLSTVTYPNTSDITVNSGPNLDLPVTANQTRICESLNTPVVISVENSEAGLSYWLKDHTGAVRGLEMGNSETLDFTPISPDTTTTYIVETTVAGCNSSLALKNTLELNVVQLPESDRLVISNRDTVCAREEVVISVENSQADILYQLYDGTSYIEPNVVGNGGTIQFPEQYPDRTSTYSVYARETVCPDPVVLDNSKHVTVPDISTNSIENFATPDEFCEGESIDIELTNSINGIRYVLQDGNDILSELTGNGGSLVFEDIVPGVNSDLYVSIGNCTSKLVAAIPAYTLQSNPKLQILATEAQSAYDGSLLISVLEGVAPYTYIINPGETVTIDSPVLELSGLESGTYQVMVVDGNACRSAESEHQVLFEPDNKQQIIVNNAITPNGDGINDNWMIYYKPSLGAPEVYVFNIYGQQVYHSKSYQNDWRGSYNGSTLPDGAYYYLIEFDSEDVKPIKGSLSILGN